MRRKANSELLRTVAILKKKSREQKAQIWMLVADRLLGSKRSRIVLNLGQINQRTVEGDTVLVPGKVLGGGGLNHKLTISSYALSATAAEKIKNAGARFLHLEKLVEENPKGTDVKVIR